MFISLASPKEGRALINSLAGNFSEEQGKKWKEDPCRQENLLYYENDDSYICPERQKQNFIVKRVRISD